MGTLLSILGSIGIISSGAGATATATTTVKNVDLIMEDVILNPTVKINPLVEALIKDLKFRLQTGIDGFEECVLNLAKYIKINIPEGLSYSEVIEYLESSATQIATFEAEYVEGGIIAGSFGTAAETVGISLAIGAAIYGGYYTYQHWDSVKHFASEAAKTAEHYVSSATDYLKSWWPF